MFHTKRLIVHEVLHCNLCCGVSVLRHQPVDSGHLQKIFTFDCSLKNWAVFIGDTAFLISQSQCSWFLTESDLFTHQPQGVCQPCEICQLGWSRVSRGHNIQGSCDIQSNLYWKREPMVLVGRVNNHTGEMIRYNWVGRV